MHELSLVTGMLDMVRNSAEENCINKVNRINLVVGKLSMVMIDSLQFCFEALRDQEPLFQGTELIIEERDAILLCQECGTKFILKSNYSFLCPDCGHANAEMISGRELYVDSYEGDYTEWCR